MIMGTSTTSGSNLADRQLDGKPAALSPAPSLSDARALFLGTLAGRADRTRRTYATALDRLADFLAERGIAGDTSTRDLPADLLEGFYLWCVRRYGTASRSCPTYLAGARAFCRFLDRQAPGPAPPPAGAGAGAWPT